MPPKSAIILAAGRGARLSPITDTIPKPLLRIGRTTLIDHHLTALNVAGIDQITINVAHLGAKIIDHVSQCAPSGLDIYFSQESNGALETGGGILQALNHVASDPFVVVNADIRTDFAFDQLPDRMDSHAHLILVENPAHHPKGDFRLDAGQVKLPSERPKENLTFSGIGIYRKKLFDNCSPGRFPLAPILKQKSQDGLISGSLFTGRWIDVGTPERLDAARKSENND
ncbi:MAG: nucleotidyltransferase family protein [Proteobacteria bacterium]|nr:nucleotidyltransferase family protein [Pseudomonadota bacterium]